jgi:DNA-binding transcriptional LysR family regulator
MRPRHVRADTGRVVMLLAIEPRDFRHLEAFGADAVESEDGGDYEPDDCSPMSACWFYEGGARFFERPTDQELDLVPPKQIGRVARIARAVALGLLLVMVPEIAARADQASIVAPLPMSTAQAPQQCCRICQKGKPCGDGCISAERQCRKESGCACSAASGS